MKKTIQFPIFFLILSFGIVSLVYSKKSSSKNEDWNLMELSKTDPTAKAWLVQIQGDSILIYNNDKNQTKPNKLTQKKENKQKFSDPQPVYAGDIIVTGINDRATILLRDGSVIWVNYLTIFKITDLNVPSVVPGQSVESYKVNLQLKVGGVRVRVPKVRTIQKKFSVQTPQGVASVRGTEQVVRYSPQLGLQVQVLSGLVEVQNRSKGKQYATRGEKVEVNTESRSVAQTTNQQRRSEVQKNIQIASGTAPTQTQEQEQLQTITSIPSVIPVFDPPVAKLPTPIGSEPVVKQPLSVESIKLRKVLTNLFKHPTVKGWSASTKKPLQDALVDDKALNSLTDSLQKRYGSITGYEISLQTRGLLPR